MTFDTLKPLIGLILIPIIIILYILKQKGKEIRISSNLLWKESIKNTKASKPWEKLIHNILMYLQILTVILILLVLMGPAIKGLGGKSDNVVIVIDNTASMSTLYDKNNTRLEEALNRSLDYIDNLKSKCEITIVTTANGGEIQGSAITSKLKAKSRVKAIEPTVLPGSCNDVVELVRSIVGDDSQVTFITDTAVNMEDINGQVINLNNAQVNYSIDSLSSSEVSGDARTVLARVNNYGSKEADIEVTLSDEDVLDVESVTVPAGGSNVVYFEDIKTDSEYLKAELENEDALSADNSTGLILKNEKQNKVLLVTEGNTFLEEALKAYDQLEVYKSTDTDVVNLNESYDLYIFDDCVPDSTPVTGSVIYIHPEDSDDLGVDGSVKDCYVSFEETDITKYLTGDSSDSEQVGITEGLTFEVPEWAESYVSSGDKSLGYFGSQGNSKIMTLGFDIHSSDMALKSEFPVLIYDMLNYCLDRSILESNSYITGDCVNISGSDSKSDIEIIRPDDKKDVISSDTKSKTYEATDEIGVYDVNVSFEGEESNEKFYVNFPVESESYIDDSSSEKNAIAGEDKSLAGSMSLLVPLLIVLLILMVTEWAVYVRQY